MAAEPPARLLLIVTGSTLRAEELDRPLAYYLMQRIDRALNESIPPLGPFRIRVVADFRWIHEKKLQALPTISIGGARGHAPARDRPPGGPPPPPPGGEGSIPKEPPPPGGPAPGWGGGDKNHPHPP